MPQKEALRALEYVTYVNPIWKQMHISPSTTPSLRKFGAKLKDLQG